MNPLCVTGGRAVDGQRARGGEGLEIRSNRASQRGFTLIELLVVIAIIAILAAVLLPVLAHAKLKATQAYCVNNQKELAAAYVMYVGDNRETLPAPFDMNGNFIFKNMGNAGGFWGLNRNFPPFTGGPGTANLGAALQNAENCLMTNNLFFQYAGNVGSYHCPGDVRFTQAISSPDIDWAYDSYAIPENVQPGGSDTDGFTKMAQIHRVSDCMIFVEQADPRGYNEGTFVLEVTVPNPSPVTRWEDIFSMYHGDVGTFAFADGHAEAHRWHDNHIIADGLLSVSPGSTFEQYSKCPGGTAVLPQKGFDVAYLLRHCVSPSNP
jgi:prepilin-type N-terminal cleavage/methylation domain-containing protein/prepilin-type processing-associated H-X9-DG protein